MQTPPDTPETTVSLIIIHGDSPSTITSKMEAATQLRLSAEERRAAVRKKIDAEWKRHNEAVPKRNFDVMQDAMLKIAELEEQVRKIV